MAARHRDRRRAAHYPATVDAVLCLDPYVGGVGCLQGCAGSAAYRAAAELFDEVPRTVRRRQAPARWWCGRIDVGEWAVVFHLINLFGSLARRDAIAGSLRENKFSDLCTAVEGISR